MRSSQREQSRMSEVPQHQSVVGYHSCRRGVYRSSSFAAVRLKKVETSSWIRSKTGWILFRNMQEKVRLHQEIGSNSTFYILGDHSFVHSVSVMLFMSSLTRSR